METSNPYQTPEADVQLAQEEFYQPRLFSFKGRLNRSRFVCYYALLCLIMMAPMLIGFTIMSAFESIAFVGAIVMFVPMFFIFVYMIGLSKRRFNDLNRTGWYMLAAFIPILGLLVTLYVVLAPGDTGSNDYGQPAIKNPKQKTIAIVLGVVYLLLMVAAFMLPGYEESIQQMMNS